MARFYTSDDSASIVLISDSNKLSKSGFGQWPMFKNLRRSEFCWFLFVNNILKFMLQSDPQQMRLDLKTPDQRIANTNGWPGKSERGYSTYHQSSYWRMATQSWGDPNPKWELTLTSILNCPKLKPYLILSFANQWS